MSGLACDGNDPLAALNSGRAMRVAHARRRTRPKRAARSLSQMKRCAVRGTVVATVATSSEMDGLRALSSSAFDMGFRCVVVQPATELRLPEDVQRQVFALPRPKVPLAPRRRWCHDADNFVSRRAELHRAHLWRAVLHGRLDLLAIDVMSSLASNPLPHLHSLAAHESDFPQVVGMSDGWYLRHELIWVRSTEHTRALAAVAENRTWATGFQLAWNEELSYRREFKNVSCCFTSCISRFVKQTQQQPGHRARDATPIVSDCLRGAGSRTPLVAADPPPDSRVRWTNPGWRPDHFNTHRPGSTDSVSRCTRESNSCFRRPAPQATTDALDTAAYEARPMRYPADRMYAAAETYASPCFRFLRGIQPSVLQLAGVDGIAGTLRLGPDLGIPPQTFHKAPGGRTYPLRFFNPSIVPAPSGLCPRCALLLTLRADCDHQCDETSLFSVRARGGKVGTQRLFRGTILVVLDSSLRRLGWTWLLNAPRTQVAAADEIAPAGSFRNRSLRFLARQGDADGFSPAHPSPVYDIRLLTYRSQLFASFVVTGDVHSTALNLIHVQVTARPTADGGLTQLRAWSSHRISSATEWAVGRNQALFASPDGNELLVQPWLGVVGAFGRINFTRRAFVCTPNVTLNRWLRTQGAGSIRASASRSGLPFTASLVGRRDDDILRLGSFVECGSHAAGTLIDTDVLVGDAEAETGPNRPGRRRKAQQKSKHDYRLRLVSNHSHDYLREGMDGVRLSSTSHLVSFDGTDAAGQPCQGLLGVGHLHRADGHHNHKVCAVWRKQRCTRRKAIARAGINGHHQQQNFQFGYLYTHFFYALEGRSPYRMVAMGGEFCIASSQDAADCESAQFVSGMALHPDGKKLLLTFGVNDCEAKMGLVALSQIKQMLQPLPGVAEGSVCRPATK